MKHWGKASGWQKLRAGLWLIGVCLCLLAAGAGAGCQTAVPQPTQLDKLIEDPKLTADELRVFLRGFERQFSGAVEESADRIMADSQDPEIIRHALLWKIHAIPANIRAIFQRDPLVGLLDEWALCAQQREYFASGYGKANFGNRQPIAIETARQLELRIENIARELLQNRDISPEKKAIEYWVEIHPIDNPYFIREFDVDFVKLVATERAQNLSSVVGRFDLEMADISDRLSVWTEQMPKQIIWLSKLLSMDILESPPVTRTADDIASIDDSITNAAAAIENLSNSVKHTREETFEMLQKERRMVIAAIDQQRRDTIEFIKEERKILMEEIAAERELILSELKNERAAFSRDLERLSTMAVSKASAEVKPLIDTISLRMLQIVAFLLAGAVIFVLILRNFRKKKTPTPTPPA